MSEELKPCPFCGAEPRHLPAQIGFYTEAIICDYCRVRLPPEVWNRRAASTRTASDTRTAAGEVDVEAERKLFQAWASSEQFDLRLPHKTYHNTCTSYAWQGWLAARTQADAGKAEPQLLCSKCGADRLKQPCGSLSDCALIGIAQAVPLSGAATQSGDV